MVLSSLIFGSTNDRLILFSSYVFLAANLLMSSSSLFLSYFTLFFIVFQLNFLPRDDPLKKIFFSLFLIPNDTPATLPLEATLNAGSMPTACRRSKNVDKSGLPTKAACSAFCSTKRAGFSPVLKACSISALVGADTSDFWPLRLCVMVKLCFTSKRSQAAIVLNAEC
ncbi:hypothetical protein BvCmsSINP053_03216 [Escherichia coli]|nr:hypothetical protein BvCmsSINP053_03216 [Escherichia coli]